MLPGTVRLCTAAPESGSRVFTAFEGPDFAVSEHLRKVSTWGLEDSEDSGQTRGLYYIHAVLCCCKGLCDYIKNIRSVG